MNEPGSTADSGGFEETVATAVRLGAIFLLGFWCFLIVRPFITMVIWGAIIAVAIFPLHVKLAARLGNRLKLSATLITLLALTIVITPSVLLTESLITGAIDVATRLENGTVNVPPPPTNVQEWPIIGESIYSTWLLASENLSALFEQYGPRLVSIRNALLATAAGVGTGLLQTIFSIIISGVFLAAAKASTAGTRAVVNRLVGEPGARLLSLSEATVRSVAQGVLGVAIIQAMLAGIGLVAADIPAAGLWALLVLLLAIIQLPPVLILGPIIIYAFSVMDPFGATVFAVWSGLVSVSDTFLKPLLLGRGLDVPMLVILLGAIGGMLLSGIIGLFVGAVVLVLGYELAELWIREGGVPAQTTAPRSSPEASE